MALSLFAARLVQLQFIDASAYAARAEAENLVTETLPASRGEITDRNGQPLAESADGEMLVADPTLVGPDAPAIAAIISKRLNLDYFTLLDHLTAPDTHFQYLARRVPAQTATAIADELAGKGLAGVDTRRDPLRVYPAGQVAGNIVGFVNASGVGAEGMELNFNNILTGTDGSATFEQSGGVRIPLGDNSVVPAQNGQDLRLTIDRDVQWYTQQVLARTVKQARGDSGAAVVLDSRTGQVLALADYPAYDPNKASSYPLTQLGEPSVRDAYEPGSVEKVLTTAALIDQGKVTPTSHFTVPGTVKRGGKVIHDYWPHGTLKLTMTGILAKSSNVGTLLAAQRLSGQELWTYLRHFGLGRLTGAGFNGESQGVLRNYKQWVPLDKDTISFGQGLAVTALQMAAAVNTIANNGVYIQPSIIEGSAQTVDGKTVGSADAVQRRVVSAQAARQVARMMEMVTNPRQGTAPEADIPGYRVAGKTGTAQRFNLQKNRYDGSTTVSFAGFAPADQPRFLVYVVVQNNRNGLGGGSTGGPAFKKIMSYVLQKYAVPPTGTKPARIPVYW